MGVAPGAAGAPIWHFLGSSGRSRRRFLPSSGQTVSWLVAPTEGTCPYPGGRECDTPASDVAGREPTPGSRRGSERAGQPRRPGRSAPRCRDVLRPRGRSIFCLPSQRGPPSLAAWSFLSGRGRQVLAWGPAELKMGPPWRGQPSPLPTLLTPGGDGDAPLQGLLLYERQRGKAPTPLPWEWCPHHLQTSSRSHLSAL